MPPPRRALAGQAATKTLLLNSGAEAIENAVKIARSATGRAGVVVFDNAFHGRTILTMTMTAKLVYKQGFGPFAPDVYRAPVPYPYRGVSTDDAMHGLELFFKQDVDPATVACVVLEPVQGEGGFLPMPPDFIHALQELCDSTGSSTSTTRCSPASGAPGRCGRSSTTTSSPTCSSPASRSAAACRSRPSPGAPS